MNKKKLNVEGITNELEGASLYFTKNTNVAVPLSAPASALLKPEQNSQTSEDLNYPESKVIEKPVVKQNSGSPPNATNEVTNERTLDRSDERRKHRKPEREKIRHTFDIFADQLMSLREIALEQEKLFDQRVLLGELVQQALDMFISKERSK